MAWYEKIVDSLVRGDENPIGAPWANTYGAGYVATKLLNNVLQSAASADSAGSVHHTTPLGSSNNYCQATLYLSETHARTYLSLACRVNNPTTEDTCYAAVFQPEPAFNYWRFYKSSAGSWTQVGSNLAPDPLLNDVWRISAEGTSIEVTQNGVNKLSTTDATISTGLYVGLRPYTGTGGTVGGFKTFSAGDDQAPASGTVIPVFGSQYRRRWS